MVWVLVVVQALALVPVLAVVLDLAQARGMVWVLALVAAPARWGWVLVLRVPTHPTVQTWLVHLPGSTTLLGRCSLDRLLRH